MIYYTPYPAEWFFYDYTNQSENYNVEIDGIPMMIQINPQGEATVVQLLSCDPQHYLDPRFQPGAKVQLFPKISH